MSIRNLRYLFRPRRIAVIGASDEPGKVGHAVLSNLAGSRFQGVVYPVNPRREAVQGIPAWPTVADLPHAPDLAILCTPAETVPDLVGQCGRAGVRGVIVLAVGFREAGAAGQRLDAAVREELARHDGLRLLGPNCLGFISPELGLNASPLRNPPRAGRVALVSQSGAVCASMLDWAREEEIGFSSFISIGNMLDVSIGDVLDYLATDPATESVVLYLESVADARGFMSAARAVARHKPLVVFKAGRFDVSTRAATSHTGVLAGDDDVYGAAFRRAGVVRVYNIDDLFDCAEMLSRRRIPRGPRLGIVTNAGGPGIMAADALLSLGGELAPLADETLARLDGLLPGWWSRTNPVDVQGDAPAERFASAVAQLLADPHVDGVLAIATPQITSDPTATAQALANVAGNRTKPLLTVWMGAEGVRDGVRLLNEARIPTYRTPDQAVRSFMYLVEYGRNREVLYETPREVPVALGPTREARRAPFEALLHATGDADVLAPDHARTLLASYGIAAELPHRAASADEAVALAERLGYPVALKVWSADVVHKTDVGGVVLDVATAEQARAAYARIMETVARTQPEARLDGVTVERMMATAGRFELIFGARQDPVFGAVILAGFGGVTAEVWRDQVLGLPPLNERLARRMFESLRGWPLLRGYRGLPPVDVDRLVEALIRFSYLVADCPEIAEIDINPLLVGDDQLRALDAHVRLDRSAIAAPRRPYAHLAIPPYPEEYVRQTRLRDGTPVCLRPIRPEDEPLWHQMVADCSQQTLWFRFRYLFKETTHDMATRFCVIDYDRELAIVAEADIEGQRRLLGVVRLIADPDHRQAEYAVLVADPYQGQGLGHLLTDYCLEIANRWKLGAIFAETTPDNHRMLATFRRWGFTLDYSQSDVVVARKTL